MEQTEKIEAIVTENQFVENRVQEKKRVQIFHQNKQKKRHCDECRFV